MDTLNGLALEYQGDYGDASRHINLLDLVNNPSVERVVGVLGPALPEQRFDLARGECPALLGTIDNQQRSAPVHAASVRARYVPWAA